MAARSMGFTSPPTPATDCIHLGCRRLFCDVIATAKVDARRGYQDAITFFTDGNSPFRDYCAQLGLNPDCIALEALRK